MMVAYVNESGKYGTIYGAFLTMQQASKTRVISGDLVFNDSGEINQSEEWLFDWEKENPNCYARKAQKANLNVKDYKLSV